MTSATFRRKKDGEKSNGKHEAAGKEKMVGYFSMYRYALPLDRFYLFIGVVCALINGAALPTSTLFFGETVDDYTGVGKLLYLLSTSQEYLTSVNLTSKDILHDPETIKSECADIDAFYNTSGSCDDIAFGDSITDESYKNALYYIIIGTAVIFAAMGQVFFFSVTAERQANRIRRLYLANILRQDIGWFDVHNAAELNSRLSGDMIRLQSGMGDRAAAAIQHGTTFTAGYVIAFFRNWKLSLVLVAASPLMVLAAGLFTYVAVSMTNKEQNAYAKAGAIAEEVLGSIRTVFAFGGEKKEVERYQKHLGEAQKLGCRKGLAVGIALGFAVFVNFSTYGLGLWYGGKLIREDDYKVKEVITAFFAITIGTFALGTTATSIQSITEGRGAAFEVFRLIEMKSKIDSSSPKGQKPSKVKGKIVFKNVHFAYPSRPDVKVMSGINLEISPGQTVAVVGASGCGKSTLVQLLLRFYDPQQGHILLDGLDIKDVNVRWLRQSIGLVSQEPVLFDTTIAENIRYGREDVTEEEIIQATKDANAYDFITQLPDQLNTLVGEGGAQLSGGQKQRIAIARALIRNPKILLLDEATSALDTESESMVHDALDKARRGRTTLVIAHRLSTIKSADIIIGLKNGRVQEKGTHDQLMENGGIYYHLVRNQTHSSDSPEEDEEEDGFESSDNVLSGAPGKILEKKKLLSITSIEEGEGEIDEELPDVSMLDLLRMNSPEWMYLFLGLLGATIFGGTQPLFAVCFSEMLTVFSESDDEMKDDILRYSLYMVGLGVISFIGSIMQSWNFAIAGEALTRRLREGSFKAMLKQEMAWFDKPCNSTGALSNRLATDASLVQGAAGTQVGFLVKCVVSVVSSLALSMYYSWQLTLVALGFFPLLAISGRMVWKVMQGASGAVSEALQVASKVAVDAIENMRTVAALTKEDVFYNMYSRRLEALFEGLYKKTLVLGSLFSFSQAMVFYSIGALFAYGAYLLEEEEVNVRDVQRVLNLSIFSGVFLGQAVSLSPDFTVAKAAAQRIFYMLQRQTAEVEEAFDNFRPEVKFFNSFISVRDAIFSYPIRPDIPVLQNMNFTVEPGQTVALVGSSGCGKSTIISLLERFYNLEGGRIVINNYDISTLNVQWLRAQIGLVSQEPVLFDCSIGDNIAYGDNSRVVPMNEIINAARQANIHDFIQGLPNSYDTNVGEKGTQLSGGQKQRIAIARALVRNPKVLLLDEATSALDTESEKMVQEALDKAREGRTCIVIAHRLSTIQDADKIFVMKAGKVVEQGTHEELVAHRGFYFRLQKIKNL